MLIYVAMRLYAHIRSNASLCSHTLQCIPMLTYLAMHSYAHVAMHSYTHMPSMYPYAHIPSNVSLSLCSHTKQCIHLLTYLAIHPSAHIPSNASICSKSHRWSPRLLNGHIYIPINTLQITVDQHCMFNNMTAG